MQLKKVFKKNCAIIFALTAFVVITSSLGLILNSFGKNELKVLASETLSILLVDKATGTAPFDSVSGPGNDISATDNIIRTNDTLTYEWQFSVNDIPIGGSKNVTITQTLPPQMKWISQIGLTHIYGFHR